MSYIKRVRSLWFYDRTRAEDECTSNLRALEGKHQSFSTVNFLAFPSVKFRKIWQTVGKYFTLVRARFTGKSIRPVFWQR